MRILTTIFLVLITYIVYPMDLGYNLELEICEKQTPFFQPLEQDIQLLARLIYSESAGESFKGKQATAKVVVNRMKLWSKTLKQVIHAKGQFDGVGSRLWKNWDKDKGKYQQSKKECLEAAKLALQNRLHNIPTNVVYFANVGISTDTGWIKKLQPYRFADIGNHTFYFNF